MATIQIKRSQVTGTPASLQPGELAYSELSATLYVGDHTTAPIAVGGPGVDAIKALLSDNFDRDDSPALGRLPGSPTASGAYWVTPVTPFAVASGKAGPPATSDDSIAVVQCGTGDGTMRVTLTTTGAFMRVAWRASDATNYWILQCVPGSAYAIFKRVAGSYNAVTSSTAIVADGDDVEIVMAGPVMSLLVNGVPDVTFTDAFNQAATYHGIAAATSLALRWDDWSFSGGPVSPLLPQVVCAGDSITFGTGSTNMATDPWPVRLHGMLDPASWDVANLGVGGITVAEMATVGASAVDPLQDWRRPSNVLCVWAGTNDLYFGASATTLEANYQAYVELRRAQGYRVVVFTIFPRSAVGTPPGFEADRIAFNVWLRANWATFADALCDVASIAGMGAAGDEANTALFADLVHPTTLGYARITPTILAAVASALSPGDVSTSLMTGFGLQLGISGRWGIVLSGNREGVPYPFTPGTTSDPSVTILGTNVATQTLLIQAPAGQTADIFHLNKGGTSLATIDASGTLSYNGFAAFQAGLISTIFNCIGPSSGYYLTTRSANANAWQIFSASGDLDAWNDVLNSSALTVAASDNSVTFHGGIAIDNGKDLVVGTAAGTKIGTATGQKLGFWGATPVVQPSGDVATALRNAGLVASPTTGDLLSTIKTGSILAAGALGPPAFGKNVTFNHGASVTILNYTGSGYVENLWIGINETDTNGRLLSTITVTVDGEATPSINAVPLSLLCGCEYVDTQPAFASRWLSGNGNGSNIGFQLHFPIPFGTSIVITVTNGSSGTNGQLFYTLNVRNGVPNTWPFTRRLRCATGRTAGIAAYATTTLVNTTPGHPGRYVGGYISIDSFPGSASPLTAPLEGEYAVTIDGTLAYQSSGTEDWIGMSNYFMNYSAPTCTDEYGLTVKTAATWNMYRLHIDSPVYFATSLKVTWENGEAGAVTFTGTTRLAWCVWYYTEG